MLTIIQCIHPRLNKNMQVWYWLAVYVNYFYMNLCFHLCLLLNHFLCHSYTSFNCFFFDTSFIFLYTEYSCWSLVTQLKTLTLQIMWPNPLVDHWWLSPFLIVIFTPKLNSYLILVYFMWSKLSKVLVDSIYARQQYEVCMCDTTTYIHHIPYF